jgi:hypothetical protein
MAVTVTATQVDDASGWDNTPPAGHAGWNNTAGDSDWVPDVNYNRRFLLKCEGDAGEVQHTVNWEIFDGTDIPFVADASTYNAGGVEGDLTAFVNNRATRTIWARNATEWGDGLQQYYEETGAAWISTLRANGPEVVVELPAYQQWGATAAETDTFEIEAYLPSSFGVPAGSVSVDVTNPDVAVLA